MSIPSEHCIALEGSKDYRKLVFLLHCFALYTLVISSFPEMIIFIGVIALMGNLFANIIKKKPYDYEKLIYRDKKWLLLQPKKRPETFEKARISFECGLFLLLTMNRDKKRKNLVIFLDQISLESNRMLHLITR